jgi:hypothetical protein
MRLAYTDGMPPSLNYDDHDSENVVHEEDGLNEMLIGFFGDGNNDENNDHMVDSNDDSMGNYHQHNVDDNNLDSLHEYWRVVSCSCIPKIETPRTL